MSMTLYHGEPNGPSLTVLAALHEKGLQIECVGIDLAAGERHQRDELRALAVDMSVEGEGPVLVVDGEPMADSVFIGCYLDEIAGEATLVPGGAYQRWQVMTWCRYVIERIAPAAAYLGTHRHLMPSLEARSQSDFDTLCSQIASDDVRERWQQTRHGDFDADKAKECEGKLQQLVEKMEAALSEDANQWLLGAFSLADLETYAWLNGIDSLVPDLFSAAPNARQWMQRMAERPSVVAARSKATVAHPETVWAPGPEINRWG